MESRQSREPGCQFDILLKIEILWTSFVSLLRTLRQSAGVHFVSVVSTKGTVVKGKSFSDEYRRFLIVPQYTI
jgi:hypothetical protein